MHFDNRIPWSLTTRRANGVIKTPSNIGFIDSALKWDAKILSASMFVNLTGSIK